ncbi:MAG: EthD domain-containing protein [Actinomycetota bacterium]
MPDRAMLHLVAADGADLAGAPIPGAATVTVMQRDPACFHGAESPFAVALETEAGDRADLLEIVEMLAPLIDAERSMAIVGTDRIFIAPPEPTPVRYQYLMHRRSDFTHEAYLARYESIHSEFGLRTPNLEGYVQLHIDLDASRDLGEAAGLRAAPCDSMSELHLRSVEHFVEGILARPEVGAEATEDEERFVDRPRSFGFAHRLV